MTNSTTTRQNLAYAYQILAMLGLDDHTYTHLSCRASRPNTFYIQPFGLKFSEITPECLLEVSHEGKVLSGKELIYNPTAYQTHSALYQARPDLQAIFHIHTTHMVAVSNLKEGLLPISQWALHFYNQIAYHEYDSLITANNQGEQLASDLGDKNVMLLRHHGAIITGKTIQEAMFYTHHLQLACESQCLTLSMQQPLCNISPETCSRSVETLLNFERDLGMRDWKAWVRQLNTKVKQPC